MRFRMVFLALLPILVLLPSGILADSVSLTDLQTSEFVGDSESNIYMSQTGPGSLLYTDTYLFGGSAVDLMSDALAGLALGVSSSGDAYGGASANFQLEIFGPQNMDYLLDVLGSTSADLVNPSVSLGSSATSELSLNAGSDGGSLFAACSGLAVNDVGQVVFDGDEACTNSNVVVGAGSFATSVPVPTNTVITIDAEVFAGFDDAPGQSGSAALDPYFQLAGVYFEHSETKT